MAPLRCRLIEVESTHRETADGTKLSRIVDKATGLAPVPGDMFFHPWCLEHSRGRLAAYYFANNANRPPVCVVLPTGMHLIVDGAYWNPEAGYHGGWTVTGTPPEITVHPSINVVNHWHGWLKNGELTLA